MDFATREMCRHGLFAGIGRLSRNRNSAELPTREISTGTHLNDRFPALPVLIKVAVRLVSPSSMTNGWVRVIAFSPVVTIGLSDLRARNSGSPGSQCLDGTVLEN